MFKGEGYTTKGDHDYKLKEVTVSCYPPPNPCIFNNGGCHRKRTCIDNAGSAKCGDCSTGFVNDGPKGCKANCVFCEREPPISFVIDRSGSMEYCLGVRPVKKCPVGSRRFDKVTSEVIKMLETLPDGTLFSLRAFSESTYPFSNDEFVKNSEAMRKTLQNWFDANGPHKGTYMSLALKMLIRKKSTAKTLYLLADGESQQPVSSGQHSLYSIASGAGVKIHVVGVDLKPSDGGYKNLHEIAKRTGGTERFI